MKREVRRGIEEWLPAFAAAAVAVGAVAWLFWRRNGHTPESPDLLALREILRRSPGARRVRPRVLGQGIVELVGPVADRARADELLEAAARVDGVEVVVDRLWVPAPGWEPGAEPASVAEMGPGVAPASPSIDPGPGSE